MAKAKKKKSSRVESFKLHGEEVVQKVKELIAEGNVRRIIIKNKEGKVIMELPVTIGVIGAVVAPVLAAVGAIAAILTECTIAVERNAKEQ